MADKKRLDTHLAEKHPELSRSTWQKHIKNGRISVNGQPQLTGKSEFKYDDTLTVTLPDIPDHSGQKLPILYLDENVIVINKPIGVLSHSKGALNTEFTVADFFARYSTYNLGTNRVGIVHRLDRDTSGVMIGARNPETAKLLQKQFADRKVKKNYLAVVVGKTKLLTAVIDLPIARNPSKPSSFRVDPKGKSAVTGYDVLATNDRYSLIKLSPRTGRTHQLRVHLAYLNTPILGDRVYGKAGERLFLHALSLEITIPEANRLTFHAPVPTEFSTLFPEASKL